MQTLNTPIECAETVDISLFQAGVGCDHFSKQYAGIKGTSLCNGCRQYTRSLNYLIPFSVSKEGSSLRTFPSKNDLLISGSKSGSSPINCGKETNQWCLLAPSELQYALCLRV